jgi:hypothetical protein
MLVIITVITHLTLVHHPVPTAREGAVRAAVIGRNGVLGPPVARLKARLPHGEPCAEDAIAAAVELTGAVAGVALVAVGVIAGLILALRVIIGVDDPIPAPLKHTARAAEVPAARPLVAGLPRARVGDVIAAARLSAVGAAAVGEGL